MEHVPHVRRCINTGFFIRNIFFGTQNVNSTPSFKRGQQIQIEHFAKSRITQSRKRNRWRFTIDNTFNFSVRKKQNIRRPQVDLFDFVFPIIADITLKGNLSPCKAFFGIQLDHFNLSPLRKFVQGHNTRNSSVYENIDNIQPLLRRFDFFQWTRRRFFICRAAIFNATRRRPLFWVRIWRRRDLICIGQFAIETRSVRTTWRIVTAPYKECRE